MHEFSTKRGGCLGNLGICRDRPGILEIYVKGEKQQEKNELATASAGTYGPC